MSTSIARFGVRSERGTTVVQFGLLIALLAAVTMGLVALLGGRLSTGF